MSAFKYSLFVFLFTFWVQTGLAQSKVEGKIKGIGLPFMTNYGPSDYHLSNQNFDVLIGDDSKIYFANDGGILVFDGVNWTQLILPKTKEVYALTKAKNGVIYVGGVNGFGYLTQTTNGELEYISLLDSIEDVALESFVSQPMISKDFVIFSAGIKTVIYDQRTSEIKIIDYPEKSAKFYSMQESHGSVYAYARDTLFQLIDYAWKRVRASTISYEFGMGHLVDLDNQEALSITKKGFFDFQTENRMNIPDNVEKFLSESTIYSVGQLLNKYIVICTWEGLLITDLKGNPMLHLNKEKGLTDNFLFNSALDDSGILWVATNNGIAKIDLFSPYSIFDKRMGVNGVITDAQLHDGHIYLSSISGVFKEKWSNFSDPFYVPSFEKISSAICHGIMKSDNELVFFTELNRNFVLQNNDLQELEGTQDDIFWSGFNYRDSDDLLLGSYTGRLIHFIREHGKWVIKTEMDPMFLNAKYMVEGDVNEVWVSNIQEGIFKLSYDKSESKLLDQKKYGEAEGLPSDLNNYVFSVNSKPFFTTDKGIYKYDVENDRFEPDSQFIDLVGEHPISLIADSDYGDLYYFTTDEFNLLRKTDSEYKQTTLSSLDFQKYLPVDITSIDPQNVLISSLNALIHIDPKQKELQPEFQLTFTHLSSLISDSVFYGGFGSLPEVVHFEPNDNSVRFEFSTSYYKNNEQTQYKWRLIGFDSDWSNWSGETKKDYTNLPHGAYTFEVIAMNVLGTESESAAMKFIIGTPWPFTLWAYLLYAILFSSFVGLTVILYTRKLRMDRRYLEKIVTERTTEINLQKNQLIQLDDLKKRFFVNISHELRTPLTLSMGTVEQALEGHYGELNDELYANLQISRRNSERLLKMVTSILDISKLEGGKIQLYAAPIDPADVVSKVLAFFSSRLEDKHIRLEEKLVHSNELYLDQDKFETILINLLSNAFKFTPDGGTISFIMKDQPDSMIFEIRDSGDGVPEKDLNLVFDRFYQSPTIKSGEGMGVGLALTKELVEMHQGSVQAHNDQGAVFTLSFPKGKNHLSPNQIIDLEESTTTTQLADKYPLHDDLDVSIILENEPETNQEHILLVEDNPEMRQFISGILRPYYQVSWAQDGYQGLEFLKKIKPDLIVTDYLMPRMDGYEMAVEIKKQEELAFIPIIFLTARATEQDKINVLNLGVDDYLFKPFSTEELLVRIKNLLFNKNRRIEYLEEQQIESSEIAWKKFDSKLKLDIDAYIQENIKSEISGEDLARSTGHSERSLYRKVKANTGLSLMQYVKEYRLRQARSLLENKELHTVSEVAFAVGFNYLSHFTKNYKERFGKQPSEYLD